MMQENPSVDETANWKIYSNSSLGFEVKYPNNWEVLNTNASVALRDKKYSKAYEWPGLNIYTADTAAEFKSAKNTQIFSSAGSQNEVVRIKFTNNGKTFYASCALYGDSKIIDVCNKILSTFKFTNQVSQSQTSDWNTYTNSKYGFEVKYPKTWSTPLVNMGTSSINPAPDKVATYIEFEKDSAAKVISELKLEE